jgi:hypothetical protein
MATVRHIFRMVGVERQPINTVRRTLEAQGVPSPPSRVRPEGGQMWARKTIRAIVLDDKYKAHEYAEVARMVAPAVAARLDPHKRHGIYWYNRVAVQVPDGGVPREWVDAAGEAIRENRCISSAGDRLWQLGGVLYCEHCGRRMVPNTLMKRPSAPGFYYRCPTRQHRGASACPHSTHHRANRLEETIWQKVLLILSDPHRLLHQYEQQMERKRREIRGDPDREMRILVERLQELEGERKGYFRQNARGKLPDEELDDLLAELDKQRESVQKALREAQARLEALQTPKINMAHLNSLLLQLNAMDLGMASMEDRCRRSGCN